MREIVLTYPTEYGSEEIIFESEKISFGRGSDADYRFEDDGLSRLHASIYQEDDYVWIVDENSSNGTFVNGEKVGASGTPIEDGDTIKIGHYTNISVKFCEKVFSDETSAAAVSNADTQTVSSSNQPAKEKSSMLIPLAITAFALLIVGASVVIIGVTVFGGSSYGETEVTENQPSKNDDIFTETTDNETTQSSVQTSDNESASMSNPTMDTTSNTTDTNVTQNQISKENTTLTDSPVAKNTGNPLQIPGGKQYLQMSDEEKRQYIAAQALRVAQIMGNRNAGSIPPLAVERIKVFTDAYARRIKVSPQGGCRFGDNLQTTYERASKNAPFINRAFKQFGIDPQIGLYLAMIESEHCVCLQSPTGPLGMFQFTRATGENYGLNVKRGASPNNPDERCEPRPAATAAAKYMKYLTGRYGTGPSSIPLAIGSYNSGEGGLSRNLVTAIESSNGVPRDFWTLIANGEKLSKQFQSENFKYVPKFFAAAIVGENPRDFGLDLHPLSTYSN
jgi:pSer/pThr/pTyr-binding forkhead associated (FHA) protein